MQQASKKSLFKFMLSIVIRLSGVWLLALYVTNVDTQDKLSLFWPGILFLGSLVFSVLLYILGRISKVPPDK